MKTLIVVSILVGLGALCPPGMVKRTTMVGTMNATISALQECRPELYRDIVGMNPTDGFNLIADAVGYPRFIEGETWAVSWLRGLVYGACDGTDVAGA